MNAADIKKMKDAGCHTVEALLMRPRKDVYLVKGLSEAKADKAIDVRPPRTFHMFCTLIVVVPH